MREEDVMRMYEEVHKPQLPFKHVGTYTITYNGSRLSFSILVSADRVVAWTKNDENQRLNTQYRDANRTIPVTVNDISDLDILKMLSHVVASKTKKEQPLEKILLKHGNVYARLQQDLGQLRTMH